MIVSIRGTNGAGKSTLVRDVMADLVRSGGFITIIRYPADANKRKPMGYICKHMDMTKPLFVIGHYETTNGGVDTTPSLKYAYDLASKHHEMGFNVLMEGKNFTEPPTWILKQHEDKLDIRVVLIDIPLKQCIKAVRARGHNIKEETIATLHEKSREQFKIFKDAGIHTFKGARRECLFEVKSWLLR